MRMNYVMIDFENVQPESLATLNSERFHVMVFAGANQKNISIKMAKALQPMGDKVEYIEITGSGKNALDFHIAFYIGQLAAKDATAYFHIISGDKGFEPLIAHLKERKIFAALEKSITEIPLVKALNAKTPEERLQLVIERLRLLGEKTPGTVKTFSSFIKNTFLDSLTEPEIKSIIDTMEEKKDISVTGAKVVCNLNK